MLLAERPELSLDTTLGELLPELPRLDERRARITLRHLLTMTSGIVGGALNIGSLPTPRGVGPFEAAVGLTPFLVAGDERHVGELADDPGSVWDYSDPAIAHLSLAFVAATGEELDAFLRRRVLDPIGIEQLSWDRIGAGDRFGEHASPHSGVHVSARELARFGWLIRHGGAWAGEQLVPRDWVELNGAVAGAEPRVRLSLVDERRRRPLA